MSTTGTKNMRSPFLASLPSPGALPTLTLLATLTLTACGGGGGGSTPNQLPTVRAGVDAGIGESAGYNFAEEEGIFRRRKVGNDVAVGDTQT